MDGERPVAVHQHLRHALQGRRPGERQDMVDGDEAGIAVGRRSAGLAAVDQGDGMSFALQGAGGRSADDSGADNDDRLVVHGRTLARRVNAAAACD